MNFAVALTLLGSCDYYEREQAEKLLTTPEALPILQKLRIESEDPEIRLRAGRISMGLEAKAELELYANPEEYYRRWHLCPMNKSISDERMIRDLEDCPDRRRVFLSYALPGIQNFVFLRQPYQLADHVVFTAYKAIIYYWRFLLKPWFLLPSYQLQP